MSWSLKGSYFETCSCDLMCPCNMSMDHGATYDYIKIGDAIDFEIEDIVPFGVETGEPVRLVGVFHPVSSEFNAAEAKRSEISAFGIEYEGKTGISASEFAWAA